MMSNEYLLPTLSELNEFRTVIALSKAAYAGHNDSVGPLVQLIENMDDHVTALRTLVNYLLIEIDSKSGRSADTALQMLVESAAISDTTPIRR